MKKTTQILLTLLATYLVAAFVTAEIDFRKWGWEGRFMTAILALAMVFVCATFPENTEK